MVKISFAVVHELREVWIGLGDGDEGFELEGIEALDVLKPLLFMEDVFDHSIVVRDRHLGGWSGPGVYLGTVDGPRCGSTRGRRRGWGEDGEEGEMSAFSKHLDGTFGPSAVGRVGLSWNTLVGRERVRNRSRWFLRVASFESSMTKCAYPIRW
jgi:hypothetical protein